MITPEDVKKLSELARIEVSDAEVPALTQDLEAILAYISELNEVSVADAEPTVGEVYNVMREDVSPHAPGEYTEDLLREMPKTKDGYLQVKKILG